MKAFVGLRYRPWSCFAHAVIAAPISGKHVVRFCGMKYAFDRESVSKRGQRFKSAGRLVV
jgi:hypothetical protein